MPATRSSPIKAIRRPRRSSIVVDLADGNNTVAGDATNDNTTALPPGFTLDRQRGRGRLRQCDLRRTEQRIARRVVPPPSATRPTGSIATHWPRCSKIVERPDIDLDADNSTTGGSSYRAFVTSGGAAVKIADSDIDISDLDGDAIFAAEIHIRGADFGDVLSVNGALPTGITASLDPLTGVLTLSGEASHDAYEAAIRQIEFSTTQPIGTQTRIDVSVFDGEEWGPEAKAFITVGNSLEATDAPVLDLDANDSNGVVGADYTATFASGGPEIPVADTDVSITDADSAAIESATITLAINRRARGRALLHRPGWSLSPRPTIPAAGILTLTGSATLAEYQTALRQVVFSTTSTSAADRIIRSHRQRRYLRQQCRHDPHARRCQRPAGAQSRRGQLDDRRRGLSDRLHRRGPSRRHRGHRRPDNRQRRHRAHLGDGHADEPRHRRCSAVQRGPAARHHGFPLRSPHRHPHAHWHRVAGRLSDGTAADHVRQHRHQSVDRNPHHRRGRQ